MKENVFSALERKRWQIAFWLGALVPFVIALLLWTYVSILKSVGACTALEGWPPPCVVSGINVTGYVGYVLTVFAYGWLFYEALFFLLFGFVIVMRMTVLRCKMCRKTGAGI